VRDESGGERREGREDNRSGGGHTQGRSGGRHGGRYGDGGDPGVGGGGRRLEASDPLPGGDIEEEEGGRNGDLGFLKGGIIRVAAIFGIEGEHVEGSRTFFDPHAGGQGATPESFFPPEKSPEVVFLLPGGGGGLPSVLLVLLLGLLDFVEEGPSFLGPV
jgi:hypothetical protein